MTAHICTLVNSHSATGIQKDPQLAPLGAGWDLYAPQGESQGGDNWFDETDETIVLSHLFKSKKKWTIRPTPFGCTLLERSGAGDGDRTRDTKLGKLVLYQLSYTRSTNELYGMYPPVCQPHQGARPGGFGSQVSATPLAVTASLIRGETLSHPSVIPAKAGIQTEDIRAGPRPTPG